MLRTHAQLARLLRHEHASLARAQRCSGVPASAPLFTALLNYRHIAAVGDAGAPAREVWAGIEFLKGEERTNYPLVLSVDDLGEGFALTAQVRSPTVDPGRVCAYMHLALERLAEALERAPATPLLGVEVLPDDERRRLLYDWNATAADYPRDKCVHDLFEEQAARTPDAVAASFEERQLTYEELDRRANQLAHRLIGLGVGPETLVGVCLERSLDLIVALLGVLKAGGAYLPLDPSYPEARLAFMLSDARAPVLLTQKGCWIGCRRSEAFCAWTGTGRQSRRSRTPRQTPGDPR
ncbi:AMP-binding protein [Methylocystis sp. S23]